MAVTFRHKKNVQIYKSAQHNYNNNNNEKEKNTFTFALNFGTKIDIL